MKNHVISFSVFLFVGTSLYAQMSKDDYKKQADATRKEVWSWNDKAFEATAAPDSLKIFSYVVLARHLELEASFGKRVHSNGSASSASNEQTLVKTFRERVKLQDKSALEDYSTINYTAYEGQRYAVERSDVISIVGVRIIKPDGRLVEVDPDETVYTVDKKSKREAKLAIPNLEVGDILDYFIQVFDKERTWASSEQIPLNLVLSDKVPVLNYSLHGLIAKSAFSFAYTSINGAPRLNVITNGGDWEFNVDQKYIPPHVAMLWTSTFRQLPMIRINLIQDRVMNRSPWQQNSALNESVYKQDLISEIKKVNIEPNGALTAEVKDILKSYEKAHGKIPNDSLAVYTYYAMRYSHYYLTSIDAGLQSVNAVRA